MAISTIGEMNKYTQNTFDAAVIDQLIKDSPILEILPFEELVGSALEYKRIAEDSTAQFHEPGDTWDESTPVLETGYAYLKILGDDADVDNFALDTRSNKIDIKGTVLANKIKAVQYKFADTFFYGKSSSVAQEFDGLHELIKHTTYNTISVGSTTSLAALSIAKLRETIDLPRGGVPTHMFMTKKMRRLISVYLDSIGDKFPAGRDVFGKPCIVFDGIPIYTTDHITDTEAVSGGVYNASTGDTGTTIFILSFGGQDVCGLQNGTIKTVPLGDLETKDALRWRIKWYVSMKMENLRTSAKIDGIGTTGAVYA